MPRVSGEGPKGSEHALTDGRAGARLVWLGTGEGKNKDFFRAGILQSSRAGRNRRAGCEDVVNQQDALRDDCIRVANREGSGDALAAGARVHASAMAFGVNTANDAVFIERQFA